MRLYARLAAGGIRRNGRIYLPYILTCSLMSMMFYIVCFLSDNSMLNDMKGGDMLREMMGLGIVIMGVFPGIFLFYSIPISSASSAHCPWARSARVRNTAPVSGSTVRAVYSAMQLRVR